MPVAPPLWSAAERWHRPAACCPAEASACCSGRPTRAPTSACAPAPSSLHGRSMLCDGSNLHKRVVAQCTPSYVARGGSKHLPVGVQTAGMGATMLGSAARRLRHPQWHAMQRTHTPLQRASAGRGAAGRWRAALVGGRPSHWRHPGESASVHFITCVHTINMSRASAHTLGVSSRFSLRLTAICCCLLRRLSDCALVLGRWAVQACSSVCTDAACR